MQGMFVIKRTIFIEFQFSLDIFAVFSCRIILALTLSALQRNDLYCALFLAAHILTPVSLIFCPAPVRA